MRKAAHRLEGGWRMQRFLMLLVTVFVCSGTFVQGADWPTYRHDSARSGVTREELRTPLAERWVFEPAHPPDPAWGRPTRWVPQGGYPSEGPRLRFDDVFHAAATGDAVYLGSSSENKVYCLDAATGRVRWSRVVGGPVRLAPTVWRGKVYVGSDDGKAYCLDAADGELVWQRAAAPRSEKVLGNGRLISLWPVRTGVAVTDGVAYFGAGVFPAEGLYLYAVRADDGTVLWKNDVYGRGGRGQVSPQGHLLVSADRLFVASGRAAPAAFDRRNGRYLFQPQLNWRQEGLWGGTYSLLAGDHLYSGTRQIIAYDRTNGRAGHAWYDAKRLVVADDVAYVATGSAIKAVDREKYPEVTRKRHTVEQKRRALRGLENDLRGKKRQLQNARKAETQESRSVRTLEKEVEKLQGRVQNMREDIAAREKEIRKLAAERTLWQCSEKSAAALILAGNTVFAGGEDRVVAIDAESGKKVWAGEVDGSAGGLVVAGGRLLVSTDSGAVHCFTPGEGSSVRRVRPSVEPPQGADELGRLYDEVAADIVRDSSVRRGYCLVLGAGDGRLARELAERTELKIYAVEPDPAKARRATRLLEAAGLYGARVCVDNRELSDLPYPPYFANLIVCQESFLSDRITTSPGELLSMLKPLGGVACVGRPAAVGDRGDALAPETLSAWLDGLPDVDLEVRKTGDLCARIERGALAGAGDWTHQFGNAANTLCSGDRRVKTPLGVLWFGEPGPHKVPDRHANAPDPLSVNGRFFVQGAEKIRAYDAYNGLLLWTRDLPVNLGNRQGGLGTHRGEVSNLAASQDDLFVVAGDTCYRLESATGETLDTYSLPEQEKGDSTRWGYLAYVDGLVIGSSTASGRISGCLFARDVDTGELRWTYRGARVKHPAIAIGGGRVYLLDEAKLTEEQRKDAVGREEVGDVEGSREVRLAVTLDLQSGRTVWQEPVDLTGCVGVSKGSGPIMAMYRNEVVVFCGQYANGHHWGDFFGGAFAPRRIVALTAPGGELLWSRQVGYRIRPLIVGDTLYAEPSAYDLRTGRPRTRVHPLTGRESRWQMARPGHHCGWLTASAWCLFFRSASAAYCSLTQDYGTSHFGAIRPGCGNNCLPANGLMLMPEASSGCVCPYAVQTTVAMHHRSRDRNWGAFSAPGPTTPVKRIALNLGAPGDRRDEDGELWLGYPRPFGFRLVLDPEVGISAFKGGGYYARDAEDLDVKNTAADWIYASGCLGLKTCSIRLRGKDQGSAKYAVRLHFAEPEHGRPGRRVFDIKLQGRVVAEGFDPAADGGPNGAVVREFRGVEVKGKLEIELVPKNASPDAARMPVLSGVEMRQISQ